MTAFFSRAFPVTACGRVTSIPAESQSGGNNEKISRMKTTSISGDTLIASASALSCCLLLIGQWDWEADGGIGSLGGLCTATNPSFSCLTGESSQLQEWQSVNLPVW